MAYEKTVLDNGITVVSEHMPWVRSITLGLWYRIGSRDERPEQAGLTHFMEHMMFKGTDARDATAISEEFDALGAESNAFTSKEYTCYHARFVDSRLEEVLALLADMVLNSCFREEDIAIEREVVLEEIARSEDEPDDHVFEMFTEALFPTHPLGRPVLGSRERVSSYGHHECMRFHEAHYQGENLVISAVGNVDHESLARKVEAVFASAHPGRRLVRSVYDERERRGFVSQAREVEQAHLVYGFPWHASGAPERYAGSLLVSIFGGSTSSRLFQEVREKRGLAYTIMAGTSVFSDAGLFYVYCGTRPENLGEASSIIRREIERIALTPPSVSELNRSCEVACSQILLDVESTAERMVRLGRREIMGLPQLTAEEMIESYRAVTPGHLREVAERYLSESATAAIVSPFAEEEARCLVFGC